MTSGQRSHAKKKMRVADKKYDLEPKIQHSLEHIIRRSKECWIFGSKRKFRQFCIDAPPFLSGSLFHCPIFSLSSLKFLTQEKGGDLGDEKLFGGSKSGMGKCSKFECCLGMYVLVHVYFPSLNSGDVTPQLGIETLSLSRSLSPSQCVSDANFLFIAE